MYKLGYVEGFSIGYATLREKPDCIVSCCVVEIEYSGVR